jgi:hypothetical protein
LTDDGLWSRLPPELGPALLGALDAVGEEVLSAVGAEVPLYARPLEGLFGEGVRLGVGVALGRFTDLIVTGGSEDPQAAAQAAEIYRNLGRGEVRQGRPLDALLAAYRVGARVAWRHWARTAIEVGTPPELLAELAEQVFSYIDEISAISAEGFAAESSAQAGAAARRREALLVQLLAGAPELDLREAASAAGWRWPSAVCVVVGPPECPLALRLGPAALVHGDDASTVALVPDPAGHDRALAGLAVGIGPTVGVEHAGVSARRAREVLRLDLEGPGPWVAADHLADLLLASDPELISALGTQVLAPLDAETAASRARLEETLLAWLTHRGERATIAAELGVHPQTVRYRVTRLRELFGEVLADPDRRFDLELVLRAARRSGSRPPGRS